MGSARPVGIKDNSFNKIAIIRVTACQVTPTRQEKSVIDNMAGRIGEARDAEVVVLVGHAGRSITDYAEETGADCIIVGSHRSELRDFFLGSTAACVVRHAPCAVHVLR